MKKAKLRGPGGKAENEIYGMASFSLTFPTGLAVLVRQNAHSLVSEFVSLFGMAFQCKLELLLFVTGRVSRQHSVETHREPGSQCSDGRGMGGKL